MATRPEQVSPVLFEAVIVPHRSLGSRGLKILSVIALAMCVASSVLFVSLGAWPVGLFAGGELLLAVVLFRLHMRAARASEMLLLTDEGLRVVRTASDGTVQARTLPADWMSAQVEERPGRVPALVLRTQGVSEEVGQALGEEAKRELAAALAAALHRRRNPVFDNAQLR